MTPTLTRPKGFDAALKALRDMAPDLVIEVRDRIKGRKRQRRYDRAKAKPSPYTSLVQECIRQS